METAAPAKPRQYIDYRSLAASYNQLQVRETVKIQRVYNITLFRRALRNRGLSDRDFSATNQGTNCIIYRWTDAEMRLD